MTSLQLLTIDGSHISLEKAKISELSNTLDGQVLLPTDDVYKAARKVFNAMIDKRPSLIVQCANAADVVTAVKFARKHGLLVAVRGGGHSISGKSVCDGGLLIDLSRMKGMHVDAANRTAQGQAGLRLSEFDRETQAFGLATTLGIVSNTGIAGLTLGGGIGWLNGKYGLACDNLLSADMVTADGRFVKASSTENEDLFWGVRGGGGNFGIATSFNYQLHPVDNVLGGMVVYPMTQAKEVLRFYDTFARECPDELTTTAALSTEPDGNSVLTISVCYSGSLAEGERALKALRAFGSPVADSVRPIRYVEMQSLSDEAYPPGRFHYWKSSFLRALSTGSIETIVENATSAPSPMSEVVLQQMHGAASRVGPTETAFAHRHDQWDFMILAQWADPLDSKKNITWARSFWEAMQPFLEKTVYVNNLGEEGEERVRAAYGQNYERVVHLKRKYDPTNFLRLNQNITPTHPG